ncbi:unnamed protein product [Phytophthora fragariaefolia]|uniref:Unnamed protein product n=1 Tax=Phytophthora fragariaefolia TaxID=1490495 RepID=A0A9W6TXU9_9STRA|nr:unnamed protein product [Phytophthora fragariaefolia]
MKINDIPPDSKYYNPIPRHQYVRSQFQHDENVVKKRVASCLSQLEQFSRRFGVPAKSSRLSEENLQIVLQALHGHLEVLPTEVLERMIKCENYVNSTIEKEWVPMEKTRQQALDRFKMEVRAKSETSQGLVRQAMASFGTSVKADKMNRFASDGKVECIETIAKTNTDTDTRPKAAPTTKIKEQALYIPTPARRYSAKNQLTVVVEGEAAMNSAAYRLGHNYVENTDSTADDKWTPRATEEEKPDSPEVQRAVVDLTDSVLRDDDELRWREIMPDAPPKLSDHVRAKVVDIAGNPSLGPPIAAKSEEESVSAVVEVLSPQENEMHDQRAVWQKADQEDHSSQWHAPRVSSSLDVEPAPERISVHPALLRTISDNYEATAHHTTSSLESDQLSSGSDFAIIEPAARLDRKQPVLMSSDISFNADIPSLEESESVEESTSAVVMELIDVLDKQDEADIASRTANIAAPVASTSVVQADSVMSFDDSDIEEVVLT